MCIRGSDIGLGQACSGGDIGTNVRQLRDGM